MAQRTKQPYDYSALLGLIREKGYTQESLAAETGMSLSQLNVKLKGWYPFKQKDILSIAHALGIVAADIGPYFFTLRVEKTQQA